MAWSTQPKLAAPSLLAGVGVSVSGVLLFVFEQQLAGYVLLLISTLVSLKHDTRLGRDMSLIAIGLFIMGFVPINTDISYRHMLVMGTAMVAIVTIPYLISRYIYGDYAIRFPWHFKQAWTGQQWLYLGLVLVVGYLVIPFYMISTGVYQNWPAARDGDDILRLFLGTNGLGIWDELFFICTAFVLFRRHFSFWIANILQAVLFTSFLYELGFESWGPVMIFVFALVQGYIFTKTQSLFYIVTVHLLFDLLLFLVLLHAHSRELFPIFLY